MGGSGFIPSGTELPPSVSSGDMLAVTVENHSPETTSALESMNGKIVIVVAKRRTEYTDACENEQYLERVARELDQDIKDAHSECARIRVDSIHERVAMGSASDVQTLGIRLQDFDAKVAFLRDCGDAVSHVQLPAARVARLESHLALRQVEEAQAGIAYALKKSQLLDQLIVAGIYREDGPKVGLYHQDLEQLKAAREQAGRAVDNAKQELRDEVTRQQAAQQARSVNGTITKAELAFNTLTKQ